MSLRKILSMFVLIFAVACSSNNDDDNAGSSDGSGGTGNDGAATDGAITTADLIGTWMKACHSAGTAGFRNETLTFDATTVELGSFLHQSDSTCAGTPDVEARANFAYTVGSFDPVAINPIDMTLNHIRAKVNSNAAALAANTAELCGFTDWAPGVEKDVTGRGCIEQLPGTGGRFYQIFKLETESRLFVGQIDDAHDGETSGERPVALEAEPFTK